MSRSTIHRSALDGFSAHADTYARSRPDYPTSLAEWLAEELALGEGQVVLDLGSGTGKFLPCLAATGARVIAVEPVDAMRAQLVTRFPAVTALEGNATDIPLAAGSLDAVVCAQSFHWFATAEALAEIRRVLKPGGALGLVWNKRDATVPWVAAIQAAVEVYRGDTPTHEAAGWAKLFPAEGFGPLTERIFTHTHEGDPERVIVDRMRSISFVAALPQDEQERLMAKIRAIIAADPALAGRSNVSFPYRTVAFRAERF